MNKRSAMTIAAGLVLTLVVAAFAFASGTLGPEPAAAAKAPRAERPIVHTIKRTVTVHQKADSPAPVPQDPIFVPVAPAVAGTTSQPVGGDEGPYEDEGESEQEGGGSVESESHDATTQIEQGSEPSDD